MHVCAVIYVHVVLHGVCCVVLTLYLFVFAQVIGPITTKRKHVHVVALCKLNKSIIDLERKKLGVSQIVSLLALVIECLLGRNFTGNSFHHCFSLDSDKMDQLSRTRCCAASTWSSSGDQASHYQQVVQ